MKSLATKYPQPLPLLLLLLLLPLKLQADYWDDTEYELEPEFRDYLRELHATGPTKQPTKERIKEKIIAVYDRPLHDDDYCDSEMKTKSIHHRLLCYKEHYFIKAAYTELKSVCHGKRVKCKDGIQFCRRSTDLMSGVRCTLVSGERMPFCSYESKVMQGYVVVTCQWDSDSKQFIPNNVLEILPPK
ncbi:inactive ribonuclease-like protein 9 [Cricetulus griseus]|uniref:Inactive ribonuclease-like protein 9 n=1 Tax=Cricetulus griseus TaxID=10029 RepID=G3I1R4_CRIGR|nr:inactive ribonuclease-like protein 9 [Cricetulus griseus]XP_027242321.1 inactive ribonuclease-like protein 9 [Cricetulus griseus]EGW13143.1 Ribonuclease-like protein 9 [Cricetulus griseus]